MFVTPIHESQINSSLSASDGWHLCSDILVYCVRLHLSVIINHTGCVCYVSSATCVATAVVATAVVATVFLAKA